MRFVIRLESGTSSSALTFFAREACLTFSAFTSGMKIVLSMVSQISGALYSFGRGRNVVVSGSTSIGSRIGNRRTEPPHAARRRNRRTDLVVTRVLQDETVVRDVVAFTEWLGAEVKRGADLTL